jgi:glutamyl-tRNA reductase
VDAVISAADTRGAVLDTAALGPRARLRELVVVDIAVPRSLGPEARALDGIVYRSVDDLPGAAAGAPVTVVQAARQRCADEAARCLDERVPDTLDAIRELRAGAERVRAQKLERALKRLGHLSARDRRIVEALSTTLTNAVLHTPTVALRERRADPAAARALFAPTRAETRADAPRSPR